MLTTFELDDDLASLLDMEARRSGQPLAQTINCAMRRGLQRQASSAELPPFQVTGAKVLGIPGGWTSHKVEDLLDLLEGSDRRW